VKLHRKDFMPLHQPPFCAQGILLKILTWFIEGQQYRDDFGIPFQKCLKADAVPTIFPKSNDQSDTSDSRSSTTPRGHPLSEIREQRLVGYT